MTQTTKSIMDLKLTYPEGFSEMPMPDLEEMYGFKYPDMWGIRDAEHHVMVTIIWRDTGGRFWCII